MESIFIGWFPYMLFETMTKIMIGQILFFICYIVMYDQHIMKRYFRPNYKFIIVTMYTIAILWLLTFILVLIQELIN